jgi:hypothetical protein
LAGKNESVKAGSNFLLQQKWVSEGGNKNFSSESKFSAYAEPRAATLALKVAKGFLKEKGKEKKRKIALITDHSAIVFSQRNFSSFYSGFSLNYFLNELFLFAYQDEDEVDFYFVEGNKNLADGPSRNFCDVKNHELHVQACETQLPNLDTFFHPHV